jgi:hypothetical protein
MMVGATLDELVWKCGSLDEVKLRRFLRAAAAGSDARIGPIIDLWLDQRSKADAAG